MAADPSEHPQLSPALAEVARQELNETPAARTECLFQLRSKLARRNNNNNDINDSGAHESYGDGKEESAADSASDEGTGAKAASSIPDDAFLLRFLRSRKFDVRRSLATYDNYIRFFGENPGISAGLADPAAVRHVWEAGVLGGLAERDARGRSVLVAFPGRWDPGRHSLENLLCALVLQLEFMIASEETQVRGFVLVADFANFSLYQMRALKPWYFQTMSNLMQNAFPARFKGVYIINQPWYMSIPLSIVRPFLSEKIKTRVNLLGRETDTLCNSHFEPESLPKEFGGTGGAYNGQKWAELMMQVHSQKRLLQSIERLQINCSPEH